MKFDVEWKIIHENMIVNQCLQKAIGTPKRKNNPVVNRGIEIFDTFYLLMPIVRFS